MAYSQLFTNKQPRIPLVGLVVIIAAVLLFLGKIFSTPSTPSRASEHVLEDLSIVNMNANQAGIVWKTKTKTTGWVIYGQSEGEQNIIALDERDVTDKKNTYETHYVLIKNLQENTSYYFKIVDNNQLLGDSQNKPFSFKTISAFSAATSAKPAYGKTLLSNGAPLVDGIVMFTLDNAYPLVGLTKESGEWLISLNSVVDFATNKRRDLKDTDLVAIQIYGEGQQSKIKATIGSLSPLPQTTVLGKDYDFTAKESVLGAEDSKITSKTNILSVTYPKEGSIIPGTFPLIKGIAPQGSTVKVTINGLANGTYTAVTDKNGQWSLNVARKLPVGNYTLSVMLTSGQTGTLVERHFSIAKSGEQVLGEATAEASPTVITTNIPSITSNLSPTLSSTMSGTIVPTTPVTGSNPIPAVAASGVLILLGAGLLLAF